MSQAELCPPQQDPGAGTSPPRPEVDMLYKIEDVPPWYLCLLLGFQVQPGKRQTPNSPFLAVWGTPQPR